MDVNITRTFAVSVEFHDCTVGTIITLEPIITQRLYSGGFTSEYQDTYSCDAIFMSCPVIPRREIVMTTSIFLFMPSPYTFYMQEICIREIIERTL